MPDCVVKLQLIYYIRHWGKSQTSCSADRKNDRKNRKNEWENFQTAGWKFHEHCELYPSMQKSAPMHPVYGAVGRFYADMCKNRLRNFSLPATQIFNCQCTIISVRIFLSFLEILYLPVKLSSQITCIVIPNRTATCNISFFILMPAGEILPAPPFYNLRQFRVPKPVLLPFEKKQNHMLFPCGFP